MRLSNLLLVALCAASVWGASVGKDKGKQVANIVDGQNADDGVKANEEPKKKLKDSDDKKEKPNKKVQDTDSDDENEEEDGLKSSTEKKPKEGASDKTKGKDKEIDKKKEKPKESDNEKESQEENLDDIKMPDMLTLDTFDAEVAKVLTLVEFYSPYCSHCKHFAPTWEHIYKSFKLEMEKIQIDMRQVNCVESGDLCNRENVMLYPDLRLYHSNPNANKEGESEEKNAKTKNKKKKKKKKKESTSKHLASFPRGMLRTEDNVKKFLRTSASDFNDGVDVPSASKMLNTDELLRLSSGEIAEPYFVAFFPCTEEEWKRSDEKGTNMFSSECEECNASKLMWDKLSNKVAMNTGHVACVSNRNLCEALELHSLTSSNSGTGPKYAMFLPKETTLVARINYNRPKATFQGLKLFAEKINENYNYKATSGAALKRAKQISNELSYPAEYVLPIENRVTLVYYQDSTIVDEDKALLPYLLEYVAMSPFDIDLSVCKFDDVDKLLDDQNHALVTYVNSLYKEEDKVEYNERMNAITGYSTKPTLLLFQENSLINHVFQSYAPEDIRSFKKVEKFLNHNKYPLHLQLTPSLVPEYFDPDVKDESFSDKVVVLFTDSKDDKSYYNSLSNISLAAHAYHLAHEEYYFREIMDKREEKTAKADKLKEKGVHSSGIVTAMREMVPHNFEMNRAQFVYVDLSSDIFAEEGSIWKLNNKEFSKGDIVVISKDNKYFWDTDLDGTRLRNDPGKVSELLLSLMSPTLVSGKKASWKLVGSPYNHTIPIMNYVHMHGFLGYLGLFIVMWGCFHISKRRRIRRLSGHSSLTRQGIIGNHLNSPKKD